MAEENEPPIARESTGSQSRSGVTGWRRRLKTHGKMLLGGILAVSVAGIFLWRHFSSYESTDDAQVDAHLHPVSARIPGYVIRVNVADNEYVRQGTVLVEIDPKDYEVAVEQARADLANAEATAQSLHIDIPITSTNTSSQLQSIVADIDNSQAGIVAAEKQFAAANAQLEQAQANDVKAQNDLARYKLLVDRDEVSRQIYDSALAAARGSAAGVTAAHANAAAAQQAVTQARSRLASAEASHRAAQTAPRQVAATRARAASAQAVVQQKQAALQQAKLNLQYTTIVAPLNLRGNGARNSAH